MPDKEGAEEKTTKSVVSKKQKQMMGEEGYDVARDMGRVKPSKDKKDATSYPPSDEVKKTQKVNKGPSALERVKANIEKKYGKGAIMNVKKEELDLTQVAESFGGYIIEMQLDDPFGEVKPDESKPKKSSPKKKSQGPKITGDVQTTQKPKRVTNKMAKNIAKQDIEKMTGDKFVGGANLENLGKSKKKKGVKFGEAPGAGPVKTYNIKDVKPKSTPKPIVKKSQVKQATDAAADALKDIKQDTKVMGKATPSVTREVEKVKKAANPNPTPRGRRSKKAVYRDGLTKDERIAKIKKEIDAKNPTYIGKSGKPLPVKRPEPGMKGFRGVRKRTQRTAKKLGTKAFKAFKARPLATTIIGSEVIDRVTSIAGRIPKPTPPKLDVGVVGRRTAG